MTRDAERERERRDFTMSYSRATRVVYFSRWGTLRHNLYILCHKYHIL